MAYDVLQPLFVEAGTKLIMALAILIAGIIAGKIIGLLVKRVLHGLKIREGIENLGADSTLVGIDLVELTRIFAEWYTYLYFLLAALFALEVPALASFINEIKTLSVLVVEAIIITYIGIQAASYVKRNLELYSRYPLIGAVVYYFLIYLTAILALTVIYPQAAQLLNYLLLVVVASAGLGIGLGAAIAIGFGTKDLVAETVGGYVHAPRKKKRKPAKGKRK
ncbi:MAG: hypothetical protein GOU98_03720 [Candidatus Altiarchaeota archaeon]|nr:hypothetical protein [Candidatus Altiarchaeota archaeon]